MADLNETFDANAIPPDDRNFDPIPAGSYRLQVIESKLEDTKAGTGEMLTLTLEVLEGQFKGRRIWDRLNIRNQNPDAQRIAQQALRNLCLSVNVPQIRDSEQLHFKPFTARVVVEPDKTGQYGPQNRVRYIDPTAAMTKPAAGSGQQGKQGMQGKPAAAAPGGKPWNNPKPAQQTQAQGPNDEIPF